MLRREPADYQRLERERVRTEFGESRKASFRIRPDFLPHVFEGLSVMGVSASTLLDNFEFPNDRPTGSTVSNRCSCLRGHKMEALGEENTWLLGQRKSGPGLSDSSVWSILCCMGLLTPSVCPWSGVTCFPGSSVLGLLSSSAAVPLGTHQRFQDGSIHSCLVHSRHSEITFHFLFEISSLHYL